MKQRPLEVCELLCDPLSWHLALAQTLSVSFILCQDIALWCLLMMISYICCADLMEESPWDNVEEVKGWMRSDAIFPVPVTAPPPTSSLGSILQWFGIFESCWAKFNLSFPACWVVAALNFLNRWRLYAQGKHTTLGILRCSHGHAFTPQCIPKIVESAAHFTNSHNADKTKVGYSCQIAWRMFRLCCFFGMNNTFVIPST